MSVSAGRRSPRSRLRQDARTLGEAFVFDLPREADSLKLEPAWDSGDRSARTLVKEPGRRVVLTVMKASARLKEHGTAALLTVQAYPATCVSI